MAVKIRLARRGRKKLAIYDIVAADARSPRDGKFIEKLGQYNPNTSPATVTLNVDRAVYWTMVGAQPTETAKKILSVKGVLLKKHLQIGVEKGAITQEVADARFEEWQKTKADKRDSRVAELANAKVSASKAKMDAEKKKNEDRAAALASASAAALAAATPAVEEAPVEEAQVEAPVAEAQVEAPVEESQAETPVAESQVEAPAAEAQVEASAAEVQVEAPADETSEAPQA